MPPSAWRAALLCAALTLPAAARATGALMPAGPVAIPRDLVSPDEPADRGFRVFALGGIGDTREDLSELPIRLTAGGLELGFVKRLSDNLFVSLALGGQAFGSVDPDPDPDTARPRALGAGPFAQAAATWRVVEGFDEEPFVTATFGMSLLRGRSSEGGRLDVTDLSLGVAVGRAFDERWAPYVAAKVFAGPSSWRWEDKRLHGHDANRWSASLGVVATLTKTLDLQVELAPVGARGLTTTVGWTF
ncbi:MAG: hypothetical protein QM704_23735 [Anaeromyxobacteraceae bacterium]